MSVGAMASAFESNLPPAQRYERDLSNGFAPDPAQAAAVAQIQLLYEALLDRATTPTGWTALWQRWFAPTRAAPKGLYLWGGVGRGKTWLMDCFFESLPLSTKRRVHFHRFMEDVHDRLREQGQVDNPLDRIGADLAREASVLCFDEFFVHDIADAMILARLLATLFNHGVTLVATSNVAPTDLYRDGLQRAKFLPAIALLEQHTQVLNVDSGVDYRLRILQRAATYHHPLNAANTTVLKERFAELSPGQWREDALLHVNHRQMVARALADGIAWFDFVELCEKPRSPADYIELARRFNTIVLDDVPQLDDTQNDPARRFISLIDELYDRNVNLIIAAAVEPERLYRGERLAFEFQRTVSRLHEMQSHQYLAKPHRP